MVFYATFHFIPQILLNITASKVLGISGAEYYERYPYILLGYSILFAGLIALFRAKHYVKWLVVMIIFGLIYWIQMTFFNSMLGNMWLE
jgi:hypothetical protein